MTFPYTVTIHLRTQLDDFLDMAEVYLDSVYIGSFDEKLNFIEFVGNEHAIYGTTNKKFAIAARMRFG